MVKSDFSICSGIVFGANLKDVDWEDASVVFKRPPFGRDKRDPENIRKAIEGSYAVVTVFDSGKLVGICRALCDGEYQADVYNMVLLPEYQGKGIGNQMLERLCDKLPVENVILYAAPGKKGFYSKCGFKKMCTAMAKFDAFKSEPENVYL